MVGQPSDCLVREPLLDFFRFAGFFSGSASSLNLASLPGASSITFSLPSPGLRAGTLSSPNEADSARFTLEIENVPSDANPRTGRLVANSVVATLKRLVSPLIVGT